MDDSSFNIRVPKKWARVGMIVLVTALIVAPLTAIASHSFTDVPDTNTFHQDIAWLADAGVTKGCNPPENTEYCPKDEVTREQMSAFMRRLAENQVVDAATAIQADNATSADSATTADTADDADTLDGLDSQEFAQASQLLHATVAENGNLVVGNAVSAVRTSDGRYTVEFDRNLNNCTASTTSGVTGIDPGFNFGVTMGVQLLNDEAFVYTGLVGGGEDPTFDNEFHLVVVCPTNEAAPLSGGSGTSSGDGFQTSE
jgi:hypothetical protein